MGNKDNVNHPKHYNSGKYEVIDCIESMVTGRDGFEGFLLGTAIKYIGRVGLKEPDKYAEDLEKAKWYLTKAENTWKKKKSSKKKRKSKKR